jgi:hypothetical protein
LETDRVDNRCAIALSGDFAAELREPLTRHFEAIIFDRFERRRRG